MAVASPGPAASGEADAIRVLPAGVAELPTGTPTGEDPPPFPREFCLEAVAAWLRNMIPSAVLVRTWVSSSLGGRW